MALQKSITLPNTTSGNYIRLDSYSWDRAARLASARFMLFASAAAAASAPNASFGLIARLDLSGEKFDQYLANSVLDGETVTVAGQLYAALKAEPFKPGLGFAIGQVVFSDAQSV